MARVSIGKISETVRYALDAPAEAKNSTTLQQAVRVVAESEPWSNSQAVPNSRMPESRYVPEIMMRRPTVSKSLPSSSGPTKLPAAITAK